MKEGYDFLRSFTFDGKETKHLFQIAQVNIPFLSKDNEFYTVGNTNGKHFKNSRLGEYSISIDGFIITDNSGMSVSDTKDALVKIINTNELKPLVLDVLPDRYFNAIFTGTQEYNATNTKYTPLTLIFDVPEAFARQIVTNNYSNTTSTGNLFIDSEFTHKLTYTQPYIQQEVDKYNGSTVLSLNTDEYGNASIESQLVSNNQVTYFNDITTIVERPKSLKTVTISIAAHTTKLNGLGDKQGVLIFKEYGVNNKELLKTTTLDINSTDTTGFKTYTKKGIVLDSRTTSFSLQYAQVGRGVTKISQPYIGESVVIDKGDDKYLHPAWSWSADGTDRFTTKYPNENLLLNTNNNRIPHYYSTSYASSRVNIVNTKHNEISVTTNEAKDAYYRPLNDISVNDLGVVGDKFTLTFDYMTPPTNYLRIRTINFKSNSTVYVFNGVGKAVITVELINTSGTYISFDPISTSSGGFTVGDTFNVSNLQFKKESEPTIYTPSPKDDYENAYPKYEGYYSSNDSVQSTNPSDYTWVLSDRYTKSNMLSSIEPIEVYNGGTHETYPKINVTMKSDNALIAFKNEKDNILQFGTPSAEDYIEKTKLETTEHFNFYGNTLPSNWETNKDFPYFYRNYLWNKDTPNLINGSWTMTANPHNIKPVFANTSDKVWQGPTNVSKILSNSVNDRTLPFTSNIIFWFAHSSNTNGRMEYLYYDDVNYPVIGVVFTDERGSNGNYINMSCLYQGRVVYEYKMLKKDFSVGHKEINIQRLKDKIVWRIVSPKKLSGEHLDGVEVGFQKVFTLNVENKQKITNCGFLMWNFPGVKPTVMAIDDIKHRWNDTPYIQDVKNIFQKDDVVEVDIASRKLFVNGVENGLLNLRGNEWDAFKLPLGKSKIAPIFSDFATQPIVNIEVQNRYL